MMPLSLMPPMPFLRDAWRRGETDRVADALRGIALGNRDLLNEYAAKMYMKAAALSKLHEALAAIRFCAAITPNLDSLLERCLRIEESQVFPPARADEVSLSLLRRQVLLIKMRGLCDRPESLHVWPSEARKANAANESFQRWLGAVLTSRTILLIGASFAEIETWLGDVVLDEPVTRRHCALVPAGNPRPSAKAWQLLKRLNIECLEYSTQDLEPVLNFLSKLDVGENAASATA